MIIIQEMEHLPKNCYECPFCYYDYEFYEYFCPWHNCKVGDDCVYGEKRMNECPLSESEVQND